MIVVILVLAWLGLSAGLWTMYWEVVVPTWGIKTTAQIIMVSAVSLIVLFLWSLGIPYYLFIKLADVLEKRDKVRQEKRAVQEQQERRVRENQQRQEAAEAQMRKNERTALAFAINLPDTRLGELRMPPRICYRYTHPDGSEEDIEVMPTVDIARERERYRCRLPKGTGPNTLPVFPAKPRDGEPGGYIYVAGTDDSDVVKIGMTIRPPDERLRELNNTSVYDDFKLRMVYQTPNALRAEQIIHRALAEYRVRKDREFFRVPMEKVRKVLATGAEEGPLV